MGGQLETAEGRKEGRKDRAERRSAGPMATENAASVRSRSEGFRKMQKKTIRGQKGCEQIRHIGKACDK